VVIGAGAVVVSLVVAVVVEVVVLVVDELELSPLEPQPAVSAPRAITAAMPAVTGKRRRVRLSVMISTQFLCVGLLRNDLLGLLYPFDPDLKRGRRGSRMCRESGCAGVTRDFLRRCAAGSMMCEWSYIHQPPTRTAPHRR
jgi:hypothetical protein